MQCVESYLTSNGFTPQSIYSKLALSLIRLRIMLARNVFSKFAFAAAENQHLDSDISLNWCKCHTKIVIIEQHQTLFSMHKREPQNKRNPH